MAVCPLLTRCSSERLAGSRSTPQPCPLSEPPAPSILFPPSSKARLSNFASSSSTIYPSTPPSSRASASLLKPPHADLHVLWFRSTISTVGSNLLRQGGPAHSSSRPQASLAA